MKITFKLSREQATRATNKTVEEENVVKQSLINAGISGSSWELEKCGNLHSIYIHGYTNTNQYLSFNPKDSTLTYIGERCPFGQDEARKTVMEILTGDSDSRDYIDFVPYKYETSDMRLRWYEDLHSYMRNRATLSEKAYYKLVCYKKDGYSPCIRQLERDLGIHLNLNTRMLYASYDAKLANILTALVGMAHLS